MSLIEEGVPADLARDASDDGGTASAPNAVLKTLTMTGFKSFVHPTHLEFAPGITAIIGPNGSGKSNVADAIRWALGENNARVLRAKRNEELIFAGSETRRGLGMAEAVLHLDNSARRLPIEFNEIEVGRRLYKSGEAEYLVNRARVRLRDLQDLLSGAHLAENPFVVIGQGLVDQVLALRPADRRTVIEEAAGTRRLHQRREDALNRLKHAESELVRVVDILREIGPRVAILAEQAERWTEYEGVRNDLRRRALRWYRGSFGETAAVRADLAARLAGADREIERLLDLVGEVETTTVGTDEEVRSAREAEERARLAAVDAAQTLASLRERVAGLQASLEATAAERDRARESLARLPVELSELRDRRAKVDEEAGEASRRAQSSADLAHAADEQASRDRVALAEAQAGRVATERALLLRESEEARLGDEERALDARVAALAGRLEEVGAQLAEAARERASLDRNLAQARAALADAVAAAEAAASRAASTRSELQQHDGDLALLRGRSGALREAVERADRELASREAGRARAALPRGLRWLGEHVPDPLARAVRAALGESVAMGESSAPGAAIEPPAGCRRLVPGLPVFLADDDEAALAAALVLGGGTVVAPSGLLVVPGLVRLPSGDAAGDGLAELRSMAERLHRESDAVVQALELATRERERIAEAAEGEARALASALEARRACERAAESFAATEAEVRDAVRAGEAAGAAIERERTELEARRRSLQAERGVAEASRIAAGETHSAAQQVERDALERYSLAAKKAEDARLDAATSDERRAQLARLRDELDERVAATEKRIAEEEARSRALAGQERESRLRLEEAQGSLGGAVADAHEAARSADLARERAVAAEGSRREAEQRLAASRERLAVLRGERSKLALEEERASGTLRLLEEQVRAELGLSEDEPLPDPESLEGDEAPMDERERATAIRDLQRLRRRLLALEPVNPLAATELAEVGERHAFLAGQRADLEKAIADLRSLAAELATTIAEQFSATLQAVDREFGIFFQQLFNGGQASLRTSDDPDEPGIDIYARPPGKRVGSLAQLSGGERALTATALLLAILRVKPAPFCVLDEVDAALDERNVGRFTQALRSLTDRTQFIVITHNRATIEAADTLYGVSMDEGGSSKVISMRLSDLDERGR